MRRHGLVWPAAVVMAICLLGTFALAEAMGPPARRWQRTINAGGTTGRPVGVAVMGSRVIIAGDARGDERGDGTDAGIYATRRSDGSDLWMRSYDSGRTDAVAAMAADSRTLYVAGSSSSLDVGQFRSNSFVLALRARDGVSRWEVQSPIPADSWGEVLRDAALSDGTLVVVGSSDGNILVRALDAGNGTTLWEDTSPPDFAIDERATRVTIAGNRVYVAGERHTVGGRSVPYVARAYNLTTGKRLWENQFGQQLNNARGLQLVNGIIMIAGQYYNIGPGAYVMEVWGLDPDNGAIRWTRRPAGNGFGGSFADAFVATGNMGVVGGLASRARTLPVLRAYAADGSTVWDAAPGALRYGSVTALIPFAGQIVATGSALAAGTVAANQLWLRGLDPGSGAILWDEFTLPGALGSTGLALDAEGTYLALGGSATSSSGERLWVLRLYRTR